MGKIAITTAKYMITAKFDAQGTVEKPDIVGAIFGQTEGLLGDDLELRELQRTGRIGRIEVNVQTIGGKSSGTIDIPSSLSKEETSLIAASLETIDRVGPCEATLAVLKLADVRSAKRKFILDRAKQILRDMMDASETDSVEISELVKEEVRVAEVVAYGPEKLPAGPTIDQSDAIIIVEGRADVINLLRNGIKNVIAIEGTSVPESVAKLTKEKTVTAYVDGDRGGDLILKELFAVGEIDFVARAPDGKEVEELSKKELLKGLRSKVAAEQVKLDFSKPQSSRYAPRAAPPMLEQPRADAALPSEMGRLLRAQPTQEQPRPAFQPQRTFQRPGMSPRKMMPPAARAAVPPRREMPPTKAEVPPELAKYTETLEKMDGSNEAKLFGESGSELGSVPTRELSKVLTDLAMDVHTIVLDAPVTQEIVDAAAGKKVKFILGTRRAYSKQPATMQIRTVPKYRETQESPI